MVLPNKAGKAYASRGMLWAYASWCGLVERAVSLTKGRSCGREGEVRDEREPRREWRLENDFHFDLYRVQRKKICS